MIFITTSIIIIHTKTASCLSCIRLSLSLSLGIKVYPSASSLAAGSSSQSFRVATARKRPPVAATGTAPPKKVNDVSEAPKIIKRF